jgi:hypothetical protein
MLLAPKQEILQPNSSRFLLIPVEIPNPAPLLARVYAFKKYWMGNRANSVSIVTRLWGRSLGFDFSQSK